MHGVLWGNPNILAFSYGMLSSKGDKKDKKRQEEIRLEKNRLEERRKD
jgi:hypothetical protein